MNNIWARWERGKKSMSNNKRKMSCNQSHSGVKKMGKSKKPISLGHERSQKKGLDQGLNAREET